MSQNIEESQLYSLESESILLGRSLQDKKQRKECCEHLSLEDFTVPENKILFTAISFLQKEGKAADCEYLIHHLKQQNLLQRAGGGQYILRLALENGIPVQVSDYVQILKDCSARRRAVQELRITTADLVRGGESPASLIDSLRDKLSDISKFIVKLPARSLGRISKDGAFQGKDYLEMIQDRMDYYTQHKKPFVDGVGTGFTDLDSVIGGFCNSNLIILAARPGMGKTALALNFLTNVAQQGHSAGILSLEMTSGQLYERILSKESGVTSEKIREGSLTKDDWESLGVADKKLRELPIFILEGNCQITDLCNKLRRLKEEHCISFFIIDYLQLIQGRGETRLQEISNITRLLKNISLELNLPILCLSQLSRKVEERVDKKPQLSDLRESGSIEQDADSVLFLMCPDYYDPYDKAGEAHLIVSKNRHGKTGKIIFQYAKNLSQFSNHSNFLEEENGHF